MLLNCHSAPSLPAQSVLRQRSRPRSAAGSDAQEQRGSQLQQSSGADKLSLPSGAFVSSLATQPPA